MAAASSSMMMIPAFPNLDRSERDETNVGVGDGDGDGDVSADNTTGSTSAASSNTVDHDNSSIENVDVHPRAPVRIESIAPQDLGYEDAAPDVAESKNPGTITGGDAAANADDYGYGRGSPTTAKKHVYDGTRVPRRSSLKLNTADADSSTKNNSSSHSSMQQRISHRRASMGCASTTIVQVRIRGERFPIQRRRSIDFDTAVEVQEVVPVTDDADCSEIWLQPEDFAKMKTERRAVVQKHKLGTARIGDAEDEHGDDDIRGLEKYLDRSGRVLKNRAWDTVLLEQDEQELNGEFNDQRIADLYRSTTYQSPEKAAEKGLQDEEAVRDYLMTPRTTKLMMRRLSC